MTLWRAKCSEPPARGKGLKVMSTRGDLARFSALPIDFGDIGLMEPGVPQKPCFCDPAEREDVGRLGCDGIHFILLPGEEGVYCVDPAMGEPGTYVLPVAAAAVLLFSTPSGEMRAHGAVRETGPQTVIGREQPSLSMERDVTSPFERWLMDSTEYSDSGQAASEVSLKCTFRTGPDGQVRNAMIMLRGADNEGSARSMLMDAVVNMPPVWSPGRIGEEPVSLSQELPLMLQMRTRS